jgi:hypothetical protein
MSLYRQQAILSSLPSSEKNAEASHHKSSALDSYPSSPSQIPTFDPKCAPNIEPSATSLELSKKQSEFISDTMRGLRREESKSRATKRIKTNHMLCSDKVVEEYEHDMHSHSCSGFDIVDEMELHPGIAQIVATSGGLITVCKSYLLFEC